MAILAQLDTYITKKRAVMVALLLGFGLGLMFLALCIQAWITPDAVPPLGRDFSAFWSAGHLFWQDRMLDVFNGSVMGSVQSSVSDVTGTLYWHYPPTFYAAVLPFGLLGYPFALLVFSLTSMAAWALAIRLVRPNRTWIASAPLLLAPAFWMCIAQGQNGTFIALFLIAGLLFREAGRNWLAALCFAALVVKPHFGVLIPVILMARSDWRVFAKTTLASVVFTGLATAIIGASYWPAFLGNFGLLRAALATGELTHHQISGFAFGQALGFGAGVRSALQIATAMLAVCACWTLWYKSASRDLRYAVFLIASILISPYAFHYDALVLIAAMFFLYRHNAKIAGERTLYATLWLAPLMLLQSQTIPAALYFFPLIVGMLVVTWLKFRAENRTLSL